MKTKVLVFPEQTIRDMIATQKALEILCGIGERQTNKKKRECRIDSHF